MTSCFSIRPPGDVSSYFDLGFSIQRCKLAGLRIGKFAGIGGAVGAGTVGGCYGF